MSRIIITGANGGLGLSVTEKLAGAGHAILAVTGEGGAGTISAGDNVRVVEADLLDEGKTIAFIKNEIDRDPGIEAAVLLVGGFAMGKLAGTPKQELERMINLNFYSAYHVVRALLPHFLGRPEGGAFILVGARPGLDAAAGKDFFAYSMSKAMVFKLAEFINTEGKGKNVTATVVVPSVIDTEANRKAMPDADFSSWIQPGDIASAIDFCLTPEGRTIREHIIKMYNRA